MIRGAVNARHEAVLPLRVRGPSGNEFDLDAVIDTAFTGFLTLSPAIITALSLSNQSEIETTLGDGTILRLNAYDVEVEWDGAWRTVTVTEIDTAPLLGVRLLARHEVFIEFVPGGVVDITAIP